MGTEEISLTHFTDGEIKPWNSWLLCLGFVPRLIPTSKAMLFAFGHRFTEWEPRSFTPIENFLSTPFYQYIHHLENQSCVASVSMKDDFNILDLKTLRAAETRYLYRVYWGQLNMAFVFSLLFDLA